MRVAAVQYQVGHAPTTQAFIDRLGDLCRQARAGGADLVCFPEYLCVDLLPAVGGGERVMMRHMRPLFEALDDLYPTFRSAMAEIASTEGTWLVAGTFAHQNGEGGFYNAAQIFGPSGEHLVQPKLHVAYELLGNREMIQAGREQLVFDLLGARAAVLVCYDAQFPETARAIVGAGDVDLLIVPGCALEEWGIWRLRTAAAARAMESFAYAVNVQLAGTLPFPADAPYRFWARSSIQGPISRPFGPTGLLADASTHEAAIVFADLDIAALRRARPSGYPALADRHRPVPVRTISSAGGHTTSSLAASGSEVDGA